MTYITCCCREIQIAITAEPIAQFFCHCDDCQAIHGGAFVPESVYPADAVIIRQGNPQSWTLKRNPRFSCRTCGTRLFIDVTSLRLRGVNGYLLPEAQFKAEFHMQCRFAVRSVIDNLPHYLEKPKQFGGSGELVQW